MRAGHPPMYHCPNCDALYQIVRVEAAPETSFREITCCHMISASCRLTSTGWLETRAPRIMGEPLIAERDVDNCWPDEGLINERLH
jgi:hypothetical protein